MNILLLLLYFWMPLRQESSLEVIVACRTPEIFANYSNTNFKQEIIGHRDGLSVRIKSQSLDFKNLNHVFIVAEAYVAGQDPAVQTIFGQLGRNVISVGEFLQRLSRFLRDSIAYSETDLPQDAAAVLLNQRAHCIGFSNLAQTLLACAGIDSRQVNGFYLREKDGVIEPLPHRWLEVFLPGERHVFYDPQYQDFSSRYLLTDPGVIFNRIERFKGVVIKKRKKILDE